MTVGKNHRLLKFDESAVYKATAIGYLCQIEPRQLYKLIRDGLLPAYRHKRDQTWLVKEPSALRFLERHTDLGHAIVSERYFEPRGANILRILAKKHLSRRNDVRYRAAKPHREASEA